ncbi:acyl-CoA dehydrogenase family protein, partial [Burkholderia sola]|uniref:acyl-CoA dehydrogenase family protein n=1 Tax=Burkholderia sola TaxID=2843302 RepID=UPI00338D7E4A
TSSMIGAHYLGTDAVLIGGDDAQRQQWLPRCASGEWLAAFALTEPRGGSHPADMRTRAERDGNGDGYVLTGVKHFISNAAEARFMVVFAKTDMEAGARGVSAFIVPRDLPGIQISAPEKLMGIRGGHAFEVSLD